MKIAVLGGLGLQGRAAVCDLARSVPVERVTCADTRPAAGDEFAGLAGTEKIFSTVLDAAAPDGLDALLAEADVAIDMLPRHLCPAVCAAAVRTRTPVVNTNYAGLIAEFDAPAAAAGVTLLPECGLDPGIDLVLYGLARERFESLSVIRSYCGGIPEARAADNPLRYKISWNWEGVLSSTHRDARLVADGRVVDIPADRQHAPENVHRIDFPGLGELEAVPNGDAVLFAERAGAAGTIRETGRYSLRWPGWSAFWHPLKQLGFFDDRPLEDFPGGPSPYRMLDRLLAPQLQYGPDEKDLVAMFNLFEGTAGGRPLRLTTALTIERDLAGGLMAMSQGVGFPASIAAQMIGSGEIGTPGVLSPVVHVPWERFLEELAARGIVVDVREAELESVR